MNSPPRAWAMALVLLAFVGAIAPAHAQSTNDSAVPSVVRTPGDDNGGYWNVLLAYGRMTDESLNRIMRFELGRFTEEDLFSADVGYTLKKENPVVRFLDPVLTTIDVAVNFTYQDDPVGDIYQISPYIMARWSSFPWSKYVHTTFGISSGLSWSSDIPQREFDAGKPNGDYKHILHYVAVEATVALPQHKDWHFVYRLHHRSGIFGLMGADNEGTTAIQLGIRHYF